MTRYVNSYPSNKNSRHEPYPYDDDNENDDDYDDDDDIDGFDDVSDYEDYDEPLGRRQNYGSTGDGCSNDTRRHRSMSEGGSINLDPNDDNRRDHHNQLERKRRASIKSSYSDLREVVPSLRGSKASRADILRRAVECIEELKKRNREHTVCVNELKRRNDMLDSRNQELLRFLQQMDNNEAGSANYDFPYTSAIGTGNLRLCHPDTTANVSNHLPVLRLLPQENGERGTTAYRVNIHGPTTSLIAPPRTRPNPTPLHPTTLPSSSGGYTGINVLSDAASLVASTRSAFSSTSSSVSNGEAVYSSSQRSSPCGLSSSSSSTASSFNQPSTIIHRQDRTEERSLIVDTPRLVVSEVHRQSSSDQNTHPSHRQSN